jgi:hypothetical protein
MDASIEEMRAYYPQFSLSGLPMGTGPVAVWRGHVQPIQTRSNLEYLLDDLSQDRPVEIFPGGRVEHFSDCRSSHVEHQWMEAITNPDVSFKIEVQYEGDSRHPRAYVLQPDLPPSAWKHRLGGSICAYAPWERVWHWQKHTVVDFMDHVLIWLIKSIVWLQAHVWIGDERQHHAEYLLRQIDPRAQCWCGSGKQYGNCHRLGDQLSILLRETKILRVLDGRNPHAVDWSAIRSVRRSRRAVRPAQEKRHLFPSSSIPRNAIHA